jgi:acetyl-CoA C-acetyltransferase
MTGPDITKDGNQLSETLGATTTNYGYGTGSDQLATISMRGVVTQAIGYTADGRIASHSIVGLEPDVTGVGPSTAVPAALEKAGLKLSDVDLFELNEAFASTSLAVMRDLKLDPEKVNVCGGAIALGHPVGASGTRILVTLIHALRRVRKELGVASLCAGGGMGIAVVVRAR